jgi:hypothetical protein
LVGVLNPLFAISDRVILLVENGVRVILSFDSLCFFYPQAINLARFLGLLLWHEIRSRASNCLPVLLAETKKGLCRRENLFKFILIVECVVVYYSKL